MSLDRKETTPPVVIIGNDIHQPYNEMAAIIIQSLRHTFSIEKDYLLSIQTKKPLGARLTETVFSKNYGRILQTLQLLLTLIKLPLNRSKIIHYVGNGQPFLNNLLSLFCLATNRKFLLAPLGSIYLPIIKTPLFLSLHHKDQLQQIIKEHPQLAQRTKIIPPHSSFSPQLAELTQERKILFCSVPNKAAEFDKKGIPFLLQCAKRCHELNIASHFTILNRYDYVASELDKLVASYNLPNVTVEHKVVNEMKSYLTNFSLLMIPFAKGDNVQFPLSAIEALAIGIPICIPSWIMLAEQVSSYKAGVVFSDSEDFVSQIEITYQNYNETRENALKCFLENFSAEQGLRSWQNFYTEIAASR